MATTSTVLMSGRDALLIDPAWMPDELDALAAALSQRDLHVIGGFATHAHQDHLLWHPAFGDAPRWASRRTAELARSERASLVEYLGPDFPSALKDLMGQVKGVEVMPENATSAAFTPELVIHDGHAPGHTALWLAKQRVLIAGDMLSDVELPLPFYPDDLPSYFEALDVLAGYARQAEVVIPGHGAPGRDPLERVDADRRFLDAVVRGVKPNDRRLKNPGMQEALEHLREMVA
ncbi:MBL fold metallo-hydrolase [Curtobacterium sp. L1-20]|uniref:MBL fold metallo-hydrolase n=1 Tax=Curtobacterium sp. L1-20 TaxID=3138181 RepID=UPI003B52EEFE